MTERHQTGASSMSQQPMTRWATDGDAHLNSAMFCTLPPSASITCVIPCAHAARMHEHAAPRAVLVIAHELPQSR